MQEIDDKVEVFNSTVLKMLNETIPTRTIRTHPDCLMDLNRRKATGVDKIPAWLFKSFCDDFAPVIDDVVSGIEQCKISNTINTR